MMYLVDYFSLDIKTYQLWNILHCSWSPGSGILQTDIRSIYLTFWSHEQLERIFFLFNLKQSAPSIIFLINWMHLVKWMGILDAMTEMCPCACCLRGFIISTYSHLTGRTYLGLATFQLTGHWGNIFLLLFISLLSYCCVMNSKNSCSKSS